MKHIVHFSGGKDSTAMLIGMIEKGYRIDDVVNVDTTKEFPAVYEHINEVEKVLNRRRDMSITRLSFDFDYWFSEVEKKNGKNKGKHGYSWPSFNIRWCTSLKRQRIKEYLQAVYPDERLIHYQGIAYDEMERIGNNDDGREFQYPLVDWGYTELDALNLCYSRGFDWNGMYEKVLRLSCYLCPLSRLGEIKVVYEEFPELWEEMRQKDNNTYRTFKTKYPIEKLERKFDSAEDYEYRLRRGGEFIGQ